METIRITIAEQIFLSNPSCKRNRAKKLIKIVPFFLFFNLKKRDDVSLSKLVENFNNEDS